MNHVLKSLSRHDYFSSLLDILCARGVNLFDTLRVQGTLREELVVATARLLGFVRVGADLREVIDVALMEMG